MSGEMGFGLQDEDEKLELSGGALAALQEFYSEREDREKRFGNLKAAVEQQAPTAQLSMDMFSEDWNASQFWYSDDTATILADQLLRGATEETSIAVVSAPSAFVQLKNMLASWTSEPPHICLLEFDERFNIFEEFVHYDFEHPIRLPGKMKGRYDRILCDPPFLSPDCQTKAAMTVRWLSKPASTGNEDSTTRLIVCTGERMENLIHRLYPDVTPIINVRNGHGGDVPRRHGRALHLHARWDSESTQKSPKSLDDPHRAMRDFLRYLKDCRVCSSSAILTTLGGTLSAEVYCSLTHG